MSHTPPPPPPSNAGGYPPPGQGGYPPPGQGGYPPPGPYGPVPPGGPAPTSKKSWFARHKVLTGIGGLVLVVMFATALGGGAEEQEGSAPSAGASSDAGAGAADDVTAPEEEAAEEEAPAEEAPAEVAPGIGATVADGKFEFVVTQVETGVAQVGDEFFNQTAQGQFVLVHVTVTNIGDQAQYFDGSSQKLLDTAGRTHSADTGAAIYLGDTESFLNQINPGNTVEGVVVFDVPVDAQLASIELHDSPFSGGVTVALG
ncbi:Mpr protein [Actinotalea ferrariae CF5-4]|uniref:Mpr protein n=1 Tax=Actinotalea ferrariae CF5-4 TaxID=948458 RepID=A0A021VX37_9CELL|nr:DUF4352 domain-containing protein [Actinotalea ferrariae]EYR63642.1 Mpr protein [Actinotalea ferrariae CF5-4]